MLCFRLGSIVIALDFTAPALLAFLSLQLPMHALCCTLSACLLHETAHFLALACTRQKPSVLRISAAGLRLEFQDFLCPMHAIRVILLAGVIANLMAAGMIWQFGRYDGAVANLSLALFNLLPYRSTDGGTLLYAELESHLIQAHPQRIPAIMRCVCGITTLTLAALLALEGITSPSLWGMLIFMTMAEVTA